MSQQALPGVEAVLSGHSQIPFTPSDLIMPKRVMAEVKSETDAITIAPSLHKSLLQPSQTQKQSLVAILIQAQKVAVHMLEQLPKRLSHFLQVLLCG